MTLMHYVLDAAGRPKLEPDALKWARWFEAEDRQLHLTVLGSCRVSTIFLGLDHGWGRPL